MGVLNGFVQCGILVLNGFVQYGILVLNGFVQYGLICADSFAQLRTQNFQIFAKISDFCRFFPNFAENQLKSQFFRRKICGILIPTAILIISGSR